MIQLSILLRWSQFRLQCVKSFCREILLWVWDILWSVKSFGFLLRHCETICEFLYLHLCAVTRVQTHYGWKLANINVGFTVLSPLWRPYKGCKMLSILTSSGEKSYFTELPRPGVLHCKMPVPFLCCRLICTRGKQPDYPTPVSKMNTPKVKISSAHCANFSLGGLLD